MKKRTVAESTASLWFSTAVWRGALCALTGTALLLATLHSSPRLRFGFLNFSLPFLDPHFPRDKWPGMISRSSQLIGYSALNCFQLTFLIDVFRGQINDSDLWPRIAVSGSRAGFPTLYSHQWFFDFSILRITGWAWGMLGVPPVVSDTATLKWCSEIYTSKKFPEEAHASLDIRLGEAVA